MDRMFYGAYIAEIGEIDMSKVTSGTNSQYTFAQLSISNSKLVKIDKIISSASTVFHSTTFQNCAALTHVIFEGVIATNGLNLKDSPNLDKDSITSVINCLSTDTTSLSFTLSLNAVNKAFETSEGANDGSTSVDWVALRDSKTNWTISLS